MPHYTILMLTFQHKLKGRIEKAMKNQNSVLSEIARRELGKEENSNEKCYLLELKSFNTKSKSWNFKWKESIMKNHKERTYKLKIQTSNEKNELKKSSPLFLRLVSVFMEETSWFFWIQLMLPRLLHINAWLGGLMTPWPPWKWCNAQPKWDGSSYAYSCMHCGCHLSSFHASFFSSFKVTGFPTMFSII